LTPANVAGNWTISTTSSEFQVQSTLTGTVAENGPSISGSMNISGSPCAQTGTVFGAITGNAIMASLVENEPNSIQQTISLVGTVSSNGNSASGTYIAASGGCTNGDKGTWTGTSAQSGSTGTPAGTYTLTVNATSGSAVIATTVTLVVM
jgi:hypothetical protein